MSDAHGALLETPALVLSRVAYGEADWIVGLFTEKRGRVSALARGARRSQKRFSGSLEPLHTLRATLVERPHSELWTLKDAALLVPRARLASDLDAMTAAGRALGWLRRSAPLRHPEPRAFSDIVALLDALDHRANDALPEARLAAFGLRLLTGFGWGLELTRCVSCGTPCPESKAALLSPERGGLVCRKCGGAPLLVEAALRRELALASAGELDSISASITEPALRIIERALGAHMGIDDT